MKIVFEGINGSGKTTILNKFITYLEENNINYEYVSDLVYETPLKEVLENLFKKSVFLQASEEFKTSIYESLILAANYHYIQEKTRNNSNIVLYDRDYISILAYQKEFIKNDYINWEKFYKAFREIILFELKKIDLIIYVQIPLELNIARTESRDKRKFNNQELKYLKQLKINMEEELQNLSNDISVLVLDGNQKPQDNFVKIKEKVLELKK